ncbi:MAG TPA: efflux RND transporter periplasmic adaptor subunit [Planctomycetota bacterium]|nr:efflux RND transporter periplasmic adaptor subunit [Planctomycetota bacterium]
MVHVSFTRLRRPLLVALGLVAMVLLLAWLMGAFHHRVAPGGAQRRAGPEPAGERFVVQPVRSARTATAVGTVRAIHETVVASRILGRVQTLKIERAGQPVQKDDLLVELEASDLRAVVDQGRATLRVAETRRDKAKVDFDRSDELVRQGVAAPDRLDTDRAALEAALAEVERARQTVTGAESALGFATITAPITGIVVDKQVQVGDIVLPGQPICTLYDPTRLQLVAVVREELAGRLKIGQPVEVTLDALDKTCQGQVAEIVPAAQASSRSFEVKVTGPCQPGIVTGMFGRLHIPLDDADELRVPQRAVESIGQLDFVHVLVDGRARRRFVRTGRRTGDSVEISSGLAAGETVLCAPGPK